MWGSGEAASIGGPAELRADSDGHLYLQIQNQLIEHDSNGAFLETHDLSDLGVEKFLGTYDFFSNGDILLRRGPDPRSFADNVRAFQRKTNRQSLEPSTPNSGLYRCNLDTKSCVRFGQTGIDFKAAYGTVIDRRTDDVYISDTTRHQLRKYSADGAVLAAPVPGFKFPNQLQLDNERLLVADTNNHEVRIVDSRSASFGDEIERIDTVPAAAGVLGQNWPSHIARVGGEWWVNNMRTGMNEGGIYIFDDNWRYARKATLPPGADPISLIAFGDEVLVSDWNNDRVHRLSMTGEVLSDFESAGLDRVLADSRTSRRYFVFISYSGIALFALVLIGLLLRAFAVSMSTDPAREAAHAAATKTAISDAPLLLEPDPKAIRRAAMAVRLTSFLLVLSTIVAGYIAATYANREFGMYLLLLSSALIAFVILISWVNRANAGTAIIVRDGVVTLREHSGRESSCRIKKVRYDRSAIATRDMVVFLGQPMASVYDRVRVQDELCPRLAAAKKVSPWQMQKILIGLRHPQGLVTVFAILAFIVYAAWRLAGQIVSP